MVSKDTQFGDTSGATETTGNVITTVGTQTLIPTDGGTVKIGVLKPSG